MNVVVDILEVKFIDESWNRGVVLPIMIDMMYFVNGTYINYKEINNSLFIFEF